MASRVDNSSFDGTHPDDEVAPKGPFARRRRNRTVDPKRDFFTPRPGCRAETVSVVNQPAAPAGGTGQCWTSGKNLTFGVQLCPGEHYRRVGVSLILSTSSRLVEPDRIMAHHIVNAEAFVWVASLDIIIPKFVNPLPSYGQQRRILFHDCFGVAD